MEGACFLLYDLLTLPDADPGFDPKAAHGGTGKDRFREPSLDPLAVIVRDLDLQIVRGLAFVVRDVDADQILHDHVRTVNAVELQLPGRPSGKLLLFVLDLFLVDISVSQSGSPHFFHGG